MQDVIESNEWINVCSSTENKESLLDIVETTIVLSRKRVLVLLSDDLAVRSFAFRLKSR